MAQNFVGSRLESDIGYFIKYYDITDMSHSPYNILILNWIDLINKLKLSNYICSHEVYYLRQVYQVQEL